MFRSCPAILLIGFSILGGMAPPAAAQGPAQLAPAPIDRSGFNLFNPTPDAALRPFSADRPTKSFSPVTVDPGHVQVETDFYSYTHSNAGGVTTRLSTVADPVLKLGITNRIEVAAQFGGYNDLALLDPGTGARLQTARGAGDLVLRVKLNLFGERGAPGLALIPYVKLPTASPNLGNGATEGGLIAPLVLPLPLGFSLLLMAEVDVLRNQADTGRHVNFTQLVNVSHPVGPKLTLYGELYSALGTDARTPPVYTADAAVAYALTPSMQLDAGINLGLNRAAPNLQLYSGIAKRF